MLYCLFEENVKNKFKESPKSFQIRLRNFDWVGVNSSEDQQSPPVWSEVTEVSYRLCFSSWFRHISLLDTWLPFHQCSKHVGSRVAWCACVCWCSVVTVSETKARWWCSVVSWRGSPSVNIPTCLVLSLCAPRYLPLTAIISVCRCLVTTFTSAH